MASLVIFWVLGLQERLPVDFLGTVAREPEIMMDRLHTNSSSSAPAPISPTNATFISPEELQLIKKVLKWPMPPTPVTTAEQATSPYTSSFTLLNPRTNYSVGDVISVLITARDALKNPKTYGGDFFQAKLFNTGLKASVYGEVVDHDNGTYTATFKLLWEGLAKVAIRMIHSSEAVEVLFRHREQDPDKVFFTGVFREGDVQENVVCNAQRSVRLLEGSPCCCEYKHPITGESWFCRKPSRLPCSAWVEHSAGGYQARLSTLESALLNRLSWSDSEWQRVIFSDESRFSLGGDAQRIRVWRHRGQHQDEWSVVTRPEDLVSFHLHPYRTICGSCVRMVKLHGMDYHRTPLGTSTAPYRDVSHVGKHINRYLPGDDITVNVSQHDLDLGMRVKCVPGLDTPTPAGFYMKDVWTSFMCHSQSFPTPAQISTCLKDKQVLMMGDSTLRQWFEYLLKVVPDRLSGLAILSIESKRARQMDRTDIVKEFAQEKGQEEGTFWALRIWAKTQPVGHIVNNIRLVWRAHGIPIRTSLTPQADIHLIASEVDALAGGQHSVVVFTIWAHFTTFPLATYLHRLAGIRRAVEALLRRAPQTVVLIKSANTGYKDIYGSDWLSWQLDCALRVMFRDLPVVIVDVWQMTSCHYSPDNIHPPQQVIRNEVDLFLSFVCPN
ncbi:hypothetical protein NFI96_010906 [Prochilodus magdalenae]|nr:hypothetical protein NFI96_010906 [Prochilodus magdalenae]